MLIRTDGNPSIGQGHLSRCLCLANSAAKQGIKTIFILSDEVSAKALAALQGAGSGEIPIIFDGNRDLSIPSNSDLPVQIVVLRQDYQQMNRELLGLHSRADIQKVWHLPELPVQTVLLIDSYLAEKEALCAVSQVLKTGYIDDLQLFPGDSGRALDKECSIQKVTESGGFQVINMDEDLSLAMVDDRFSKHDYVVRKKGKKILLSTGSTDPYGIRKTFWEAFQEVVSDKGNSEQTGLEAALPMDVKYELAILQGVQKAEVPDYMASFDLGIFAAGVSLYEAAALGLPCLSFSFVENQVAGAKKLQEAGIAYKGSFPGSSDLKNDLTSRSARQFAKDILKEAFRLLVDYEERKRICEKEKTVINGRGAERIVKRLFSGNSFCTFL
ncbi:MAG: hypothetical protein IJU50_09420 [Lachnospiraceae bacterium]|nr:hypothetical protein [Lachnospiraceae bacterium]